MKVSFSIYEHLYNQALKGMVFYNEDDVQETISYVKTEKLSRQIIAVCESGNAYPMNIDKTYNWEVNNQNDWVNPNKPKIKGNNI